MRILFISQLYDPEYAIKGQQLMEYWCQQGHEVEVLTTFPNYPTGKVFDGYKSKFSSSNTVNGVRVTRLWSYVSHSKSKLSRLFSYMSFTIMALVFAFCKKKPDVIYAYHPQSTTGLIGVLMKKIKKVPFITDVQDLWPDALVATGLKSEGVLVRFLGWWCRRVYSNAEHVVVLSEGYKQSIVDLGVRSDKVSVVYNWCPEEASILRALKSHLNKKVTDDGPAHLVYAGNMGAAQSLKVVIEAVSPFSEKELVFTLVGGGIEKEELRDFVELHSFSNIHFKEYLPPAEVFNYLVGADILIIHLKDEPLFKITIPSKTQSSMALGKPLIMAVGGESNEFVIQSDCGETAQPESVVSISDALSRLLARRSDWSVLGRNARNFYESELSMEVNYKKIDDILFKIRDLNA